MYNDSLFNAFARSFEARSQTDMSMAEYLESCRSDPMRYANAAERLLAAIGEPQMIDTAKDPRLGRIFLNRTMRSYPAFAGFYGMEDTIERIVGFFRHAAQGLEERKQILYLLGPVGGGKSSLAERLKQLMEVHPIYVLKAGDELSPVFESPLSLFDPDTLGPMLEEKYGVPRRRLTGQDENPGSDNRPDAEHHEVSGAEDPLQSAGAKLLALDLLDALGREDGHERRVSWSGPRCLEVAVKRGQETLKKLLKRATIGFSGHVRH
jgi:predicted Ser/Thr protein kinase